MPTTAHAASGSYTYEFTISDEGQGKRMAQDPRNARCYSLGKNISGGRFQNDTDTQVTLFGQRKCGGTRTVVAPGRSASAEFLSYKFG